MKVGIYSFLDPKPYKPLYLILTILRLSLQLDSHKNSLEKTETNCP
jgi:hypothetical protein